MGNLTKYWF